MQKGDVIRFTSIQERTDAPTLFGWKAPKGQQYVAVLLGVEPKDAVGDAALDPIDALLSLGWTAPAELLELRAQERAEA